MDLPLGDDNIGFHQNFFFVVVFHSFLGPSFMDKCRLAPACKRKCSHRLLNSLALAIQELRFSNKHPELFALWSNLLGLRSLLNQHAHWHEIFQEFRLERFF
jgi:hypothetical protein